MMRVRSVLRAAVVSLACVGLVVPQAAVAAGQPQVGLPGGQPPRVIDVALGPHGTLQGAVVDPQGVPVAKTPVMLLRGGEVAAVGETDAAGRFAFTHLNGGLYGVGAGGAVCVCRAWAPTTSPPSANRGILVVSNGDLMRGIGPLRDCQGRVYGWVSQHYLLTYAAVAAAITVPVVLIAEAQDEEPRTPH